MSPLCKYLVSHSSFSCSGSSIGVSSCDRLPNLFHLQVANNCSAIFALLSATFQTNRKKFCVLEQYFEKYS